jgi:hypothetical protein
VLGEHLPYRRRRRLIALLAVVVVGAGVGALVIALPSSKRANTGPSSPPSPSELAANKPSPPTRLSPAERRSLVRSVFFFVRTSVTRNHPERSWSIVDPVLREGLTKKQWASGNIPVVPYPAAGIDFFKLESFDRGTALVEVVLEPKRNAHMARKTFMIELRRRAVPPHRWAVSSWVPAGISETQMEMNTPPPSPATKAAAYHSDQLSLYWIFVPLGLLGGGLILLPAFLIVRDAVAGRRAFKQARAANPLRR